MVIDEGGGGEPAGGCRDGQTDQHDAVFVPRAASSEPDHRELLTVRDELIEDSGGLVASVRGGALVRHVR
ncbi:hypothetical protein [Streptomyces muensis]|uniref:Uncharacterized protein n=1 Tax=Streptomyces muensis TaxID=1077944 RepID=A0A9X1PT51_STRM4|nr:hypothetical protein [Streptomyces muensis]MCF1592546.1 hypothetical protein [Streptomyces muensis]